MTAAVTICVFRFVLLAELALVGASSTLVATGNETTTLKNHDTSVQKSFEVKELNQGSVDV
jgi:hypothetical protein